MAEKKYYATGKRKSAIARVWMKEGSGNWIINKRTLAEYFPSESLMRIIQQPLDLVNKKDQFDFYINVNGGGVAGQAGAVKHGISKALAEYDIETKPALRRAGFLTRDSRVKERKKYGQPGARKRFQYSKR